MLFNNDLGYVFVQLDREWFTYNYIIILLNILFRFRWLGNIDVGDALVTLTARITDNAS